ncbi:hypothetical protein HZB01_01390 [Candidatus Woesearchaeota archaeon]|nr:hypothetical protein [Candidatus Woesearchaeota archaeon]
MNLLSTIKEALIEHFGSVNKSEMLGYWTVHQYYGPFSRDYDGKFRYHAPHAEIEGIVQHLLPHIRNNEIIACKYPTREEQPDDPFYGKPSVLLIYTDNRHKDRVAEILAAKGLLTFQWKEEKAMPYHELVMAQIEKVAAEKNLRTGAAL